MPENPEKFHAVSPSGLRIASDATATSPMRAR